MAEPQPSHPVAPEPAAMAPDLQRRGWLYATVAGAAALAGLGLAWREKKARDTTTTEAAPAIWDLSFQAPGGSRIALKRFAGKPLLLNFWATWCAPCVEELPLLDDFYRANSAKGWQVLGIAADQPDAVHGFLSRAPVQFPVALAGMDGIALSRTLGNLAGGLPFTVVVSAAGDIAHRKMGRVTPQELLVWGSQS